MSNWKEVVMVAGVQRLAAQVRPPVKSGYRLVVGKDGILEHPSGDVADNLVVAIAAEDFEIPIGCGFVWGER